MDEAGNRRRIPLLKSDICKQIAIDRSRKNVKSHRHAATFIGSTAWQKEIQRPGHFDIVGSSSRQKLDEHEEKLSFQSRLSAVVNAIAPSFVYSHMRPRVIAGIGWNFNFTRARAHKRIRARVCFVCITICITTMWTDTRVFTDHRGGVKPNLTIWGQSTTLCLRSALSADRFARAHSHIFLARFGYTLRRRSDRENRPAAKCTRAVRLDTPLTFRNCGDFPVFPTEQHKFDVVVTVITRNRSLSVSS